jgi:hypothetical protein
MKLTKENLQFIDNYLKFNEVFYFDIRIEMLDHVATAVEQKMNEEQLEFYDAFKDYMVENKKEIMKSNKSDGLYFQPIKKFGLFLLKPLSLVLVAISFLFNQFLITYYDSQDISLYFLLVFFLSLVPIVIARYYFLKRKRFFYIEQNASILFLLQQFGQLFNRSANQSAEASMYINTTLLFLLLSFVLFYYNEMTTFKAKNQYLFS